MRLNHILICYAAGSAASLLGLLLWYLVSHSHLINLLSLPNFGGWSITLAQSRLLWGGLWGLLFALPLLKRHPWQRGIWLAIFPCMMTLWTHDAWSISYFFSLHPLVVIIDHLLWGLACAWLIRYASKK